MTFIPQSELGYTWFSRHASYKNREIWMWHKNDQGMPPDPPLPCPLITGALWQSRDAMVQMYRTNGQHDNAPGFLIFAHQMRGGVYFKDWAEAEQWVRAEEDWR